MSLKWRIWARHVDLKTMVYLKDHFVSMCESCRCVPPFAFQLCIVSVRTDQLYNLSVVSYTMLIIHKRWYYGLRVGFYPAFDAKFLVNRHPRHPYHPCMVYLPTFTHIHYSEHQPFHAGKFTT